MTVGIGIGLSIVGIALGLWALHKQTRGNMQECIWCDRNVSPPGRACSTICDHELKHLALSNPDAICRTTLVELEYPTFGDNERTDAPEKPA